MSEDREIVVIGSENRADKIAALQAQLNEAVIGFWGINEVPTTTEPKAIEYKAPPKIEITATKVDYQRDKKRKGKVPRKKQNGYF